ncbi:hypothetical protein DN062_09880 [Nitrincola tibetensis]|uniref:Uncharacterized protein n=2 Tax=Nitrincola TaxID=267849 RepID=A0A364NLZ0_9GAMM|nr:MULTISPECIES: hypothetical protein [Nitrincola]EXJ09678.1 hypothetical protein D791_03350 [Nitrincola nitratireducens]RAU18082.1 hypothetical protein DN062_09880 [Nitrincola tibetensis]
MLIRSEQDLSPIQTEVFDLLIGYDVEQTNMRKKLASKRLLEARRAIEKRREELELAAFIDQESWFEG